MAVTGLPISGVNCRVQWAGVNLNQGKWQVVYQIGDIPTTNFESNANDEGIVGIQGCEWEFSGFYDASLAPFTAVGLVPGVIAANLKLFVSKTLNSFWRFPQVRLLSATVDAEVDNKRVEITLKGKSDGPFFVPAV